MKSGSVFYSTGSASANARMTNFLSDLMTKGQLGMKIVALIWIGEMNKV